jgi:hypothetical protein
MEALGSTEPATVRQVSLSSAAIWRRATVESAKVYKDGYYCHLPEFFAFGHYADFYCNNKDE